MLNRKFAMALGAVMVLAVLYGCSSSNSGIKHERDTAQEQVKTLQGSLDKVADALNLPAGSSEAEILTALATATEDQLVTIRDALDLAADATAADIVTSIGLLQVDELVTIRDALDLAADATVGDILAAIRGLQAEPVEDKKAADVVGPAILASEMTMPTDGTDPERTADNTRIAVDGLTATDQGDDDAPGGTNIVDGAQNADTKLKASDKMGAMVSGFEGGVFAQDNGTDTKDPTQVDTVYVYSDKEPNTAQEYSMYWTSTTVSDMTNGADEGVSTVNTVADKLDTLTLSASATEHPMSSALPSANQSYTDYEDDADTTDNEASFDGTFRGVAGGFSCVVGSNAGDVCRATRDEDGKVSFTGGVWTFTPTEPEGEAKVMVAGVIPDPDYLTFGFWLRETTDKDGKVSAMIETLYGTEAAYTTATADGLTGEDLEGEATYSGSATGKFIRKEFTSGGDETVVAGGQFTATADLTAYFGEPTSVAMDNHNMIDGSITDFKDGHGNDIDDTWTLTLNATSFADSDADNNVFSGGTEGDKGAGAGFWEGIFAGAETMPDPDDNTATVPVRPSGVVGEFNGHFNNGHVVGAFGATLDE
ncbi:MAG: hypothetical protein OXE53_04085 [Deltaproteobacteria bacterium]|nr:hypothetical protein [Deltaproteobacteria bacterium]